MLIPEFPIHYFQTGEFDWSRDLEGVILSAFSYGYLVMMPFGGYVANRIGAKMVLLTRFSWLRYLHTAKSSCIRRKSLSTGDSGECQRNTNSKLVILVFSRTFLIPKLKCNHS